MRISDWSSDVCASDRAAVALIVRAHDDMAAILREAGARDETQALRRIVAFLGYARLGARLEPGEVFLQDDVHDAGHGVGTKNGRASGRERGCQYVSISVVAVSLKKKKTMITTE